MIPKNLKLPLTLLLTLALLIALIPTAQAASILPACVAEGYCTLCDILQTVINFGQFLLGIVGSLALLMFVYGGLTWLTSGGEPDKITAGKKILINSVVGLAITFFAYVIVIFVVSTLAPNWSWQDKMNLSCAPLAGLEPANPGDWDAGGLKKEGATCASSEECEMSLYCNKTTSKCTQKIASTASGTPANPLNDCAGMEIGGKDDLACQSGVCVASGYNVIETRCKGAATAVGSCCESGKAGGGEVCTGDKPCQDNYFCSTTSANATSGTCQNKKNTGEQCRSSMILGGNDPSNLLSWITPLVTSSGQLLDSICKSNDCEEGICTPELFKGKEGDACTSPWDCSNPCTYYVGVTAAIPGVNFWTHVVGSTFNLSCDPGELFCWEYADNRDDDRGNCTKAPLPPDAKCEDGAIIPGNNPNAPCREDYKCGEWTPTISTDTCILK